MRRSAGVLAMALAAAAGLAPAASAADIPAGGPRPPSPSPSRVPVPPSAVKRFNFGVRLVDIPVDEAHNPRALAYIIDFLPTGSTIHRRIIIFNHERRTAHFTVYPSAASISQGRFIGAAGQTASELTSWVTVQHPAVTIGPGQSKMVMITIHVPAGATSGEHFGVIWAQQSRNDRVAKNVTIKQIGRVGIRVYLAVGHGGAPPTKFVVTAMDAGRTAGRRELVVHVTNTGGRAVDLDGTLRLTGGPGGTSAGPIRASNVETLAAGQSGNVIFVPPPGLPDGPWDAHVHLVSGLTTANTSGTIQFAKTLTPAQLSAQPPGRSPGKTMLIAAAAVLALVLLAAWLITGRRRRARA